MLCPCIRRDEIKMGGLRTFRFGGKEYNVVVHSLAILYESKFLIFG